jgi:purine-binding chemotaxis protein CheW
MVFELADGRFGIRSSEVREVLRAVTISPLPGAPPELEGVINVRGRVLPVVDLRALLGLPPKPLQHTDHLIVVQTDERLLAVRVDRAVNLAPVSASEIQSAEAIAIGLRYVREIARTPEGLVHVLAPTRFLSAVESAAWAKSLETSVATEVSA